jgi:predicted NBD/HSP70 family sugar kinase
MASVHHLGSLASLRERNRRRVVEVLRRRGTVSRADIARETGLSRTTVSSIVGAMQRDGLITECESGPDGGPGSRTGEGGRPPILLTFDPSAGALVGIDFGHDRVRVAVSDLSYGSVREEAIDVDVDADATGALDSAAACVERLLADVGVQRERVFGVGVGLPGPIDRRSGLVRSDAILPAWVELEPAAELERRLGLTVHLDNDANVGALGEAMFGAARGRELAAYVRLAAGVGVGLIVDGRTFRGASGTAGELGHVLVDPAGPICRCGNRGCLETFVSAPALCDQLVRSHGALTTARLLELAAGGDRGCRRVLHDAGRVVGRALADLCNTINPDAIVVGGELSGAGEVLLEPLRAAIWQHAIPAAAAGVIVTTGALGERAELLGALALAGQQSASPGFAPLTAAVGDSGGATTRRREG